MDWLKTNHCLLVIGFLLICTASSGWFSRQKGSRDSQNVQTKIKSTVYVVLIPSKCTDRLQPLDLSVNKSVKDFLRQQFQEWYAGLVCAQVQKSRVELIDLRLSVVKSLGAKWMDKLYDYLKSKPEIVCTGF